MRRQGGYFNNLAKREFSGDLDQDNSSRSDKKYIFWQFNRKSLLLDLGMVYKIEKGIQDTEMTPGLGHEQLKEQNYH